MFSEPKKVARLQPGSRIAVVAPSGMPASGHIARVCRAIERHDFEAVNLAPTSKGASPFSHREARRVECLMEALTDPRIQMVFCVRGGYGVSRIIDRLDFDRISQAVPKCVVGFSDITLLLLAIRRRLGWVCFHAPMGVDFIDRGRLKQNATHLIQFLTDTALAGRPLTLDKRPLRKSQFYRSGEAHGIATGGNLSLVVASLGTRYEVERQGTILFLEEVSEPHYKIERNLLHLRMAGLFDSLEGLVFGRLERCPENGIRFKAMLKEVFAGYSFPIVTDFPIGHGAKKATVPFGCRVGISSMTRQVWTEETPFLQEV